MSFEVDCFHLLSPRVQYHATNAFQFAVGFWGKLIKSAASWIKTSDALYPLPCLFFWYMNGKLHLKEFNIRLCYLRVKFVVLYAKTRYHRAQSFLHHHQ